MSTRVILTMILVIVLAIGAYFAYSNLFVGESAQVFSAVSTDRAYGFLRDNQDLYGPFDHQIDRGSELIAQRFFSESVIDDESLCPASSVFPEVKALSEECLPSRYGYLARVLDDPSDDDPTDSIEAHPDPDGLIFVLGFADASEANAYADLLVEQLNLSPSYPYSEVRVGAEFVGSRLNPDSSAQVYHHTGWNTTLGGYRNTLVIVDREYVFVARSMSETQGQTYDLRAVTSDRIYDRVDS